MNSKVSIPLVFTVVMFLTKASIATDIVETLEPPNTPGNAYSGTFLITPSETTWAFGVGNDNIQDTAISGIRFIDGLEASDHWISALISKTSWDAGFDFDSIRPIGATPPSSFSVNTSSISWQWGSSEYVAFYWLSEAGSSGSPLAVLQPGTEYDAFRFFTSGPNSPFAAFGAADGGNIITGETTVVIQPTKTATPAATNTPSMVPTPEPTLSRGGILFNFSLVWFETVNEEFSNAEDLLNLIGQIAN